MKNYTLSIISTAILSFLVGISSYAQTNIALWKTVVAQSVEDNTPQFAASNINDGNATTKWSSSGSDYKQWIYIDLGRAYKINKVVLKYIDSYCPNAYQVQVSNNASQWSPIYTWQGGTTFRTSDEIIPSGVVSGRYVRFSGNGRGTIPSGSSARYRIAEFEVYGEDMEPVTPEQQAGIDIITDRLVQRELAVPFDLSGVTSSFNSMLADGTWSDVDYTTVDQYFRPGVHLNRLKDMARAYRTPGNPYYESEAMLDKIKLGYDGFLLKNPKSSNWWYNDIGGPQNYMVPLLLLKGKMDKAELVSYSERYLKDQVASFLGDAKNLTWVANISIYKGCIEDNYNFIDQAFKAIYSVLVIVPTQGDEGIKRDYSFHQHHAQIQSGAYGMSILTDFANAIELSEGTVFINSITSENRGNLSNLLRQGHQLLGYRHTMDFGVSGRGITLETPTNYTTVPLDVLERMKAIDPTNVTDYNAWIDHISGTSFPDAYRGNKYFWNSDIMTQHGANYYLSAKVISKRTYGTESINGENVKGYNLPLGATNILTDGDEYNRIYPVWDWTRIPGTTAERNEASASLSDYLIGTNQFGGGVSSGESGAIAFESDYRNVQAKKSYFFMADAMLCLGAGINGDFSNPVNTSVNQALLSGDININDGTTHLFTGSSATETNLQWVHHRNVGYIFPSGGNITIQNKQQSGTWKSIHSLGSTNVVNKQVFSLWIDHGNHPVNATYSYIVMPDKNLSDFEASVNNHGFVVVQNDADIQAVRNDKVNKYAVVFYNPGTIDMGDGLTVTSDKKAMVLFEKEGNGYKVSVADPAQLETTINITINKNLTGPNATYNAGNTTIAVTLPLAEYRGSSVINSYTDTALPVTLTAFTAVQNNDVAKLKWTTVSETRNDKFEIYRSVNGDGFEKIGELAGAGTTTAQKEYVFYDKHPQSGVNYYQLIQVDQDGKITQHGVRTVSFTLKDYTVKVFPNPATQNVNISFKSGTYTSLELLSLEGKILKSIPINSEESVSIPLQEYPAGTYLIRLKGNTEIEVRKLIKR
ncbi:MAG TPA: polysaccharide lyase family 8 super-sandwich domain-containing protein [Pelobium sp.]|nr:polysaccharide lyase family 8 super-sandwich domain-containing protein [Pelobium sp.]